jgi:hypothetical protein
MTRLRLGTMRCSKPGVGKSSFSSPKRPDGRRDHLAGTGLREEGLFTGGVTRPEREVGPSIPSRVM